MEEKIPILYFFAYQVKCTNLFSQLFLVTQKLKSSAVLSCKLRTAAPLLFEHSKDSWVAVEYGISSYPTYILVDPSGKIIMRTENEIEKIESELQGIFKSGS